MPELTQAPDQRQASRLRRVRAIRTSTCSARPASILSSQDSRYEARDALPETLIALQDVLGLSMAVIVSPAGYDRDTAMLADVLSKYPDRFRGIALMQLRRSGIYSVSRTIDDNRSTLEHNHRAAYCNDAAYQAPAHAAAGG